MDRVGSERRATSPLGVATARLRALDRTLADARTRLAAVAVEQERLAGLEATLADETGAWVQAERARVAGRLADVADRREPLRRTWCARRRCRRRPSKRPGRTRASPLMSSSR